MDDMTNFERQLSGGFQGLMGPSEPVDDAKIFDAATAQSPKWRFQSMFSATRIVAAGVIVALFGGFLMAGLLTQPPDTQLPAGVSPSPIATADLLPGVDLVTEVVEPGVYRVMSDGLRELSGSASFAGSFAGRSDSSIVAGLDESVWWLGREDFFRLGDGRIHAWPTDPSRVGGVSWGNSVTSGVDGDDIEVGPGGTMWLARPDDLRSFDGKSWTIRRVRPALGAMRGVEVQLDGTVWAAERTTGDKGRQDSWRVVRLDMDGWEVLPGEIEKVRDPDIAVAEDGGHEAWKLPGSQRLQRHDGSGWSVQSVPESLLSRPDLQGPLGAAVGPDGKMLWVLLRSGKELARFDGSDWDVYGPDVLPTIGSFLDEDHPFEVARDGSLWFNTVKPSGNECDGVANFDGDTVRYFLRDLCVYAMDMAPDGSLWLQAGESSYEPERSSLGAESDPVHVYTYVITAEVLAATP